MQINKNIQSKEKELFLLYILRETVLPVPFLQSIVAIFLADI